MSVTACKIKYKYIFDSSYLWCPNQGLSVALAAATSDPAAVAMIIKTTIIHTTWMHLTTTNESDSDAHNTSCQRQAKQPNSQSSNSNCKIPLPCLSWMPMCHNLLWLQAWNMTQNMSEHASAFFIESQNTWFNLLQAQAKKQYRSDSSNSNECEDRSYGSEVVPYLICARMC